MGRPQAAFDTETFTRTTALFSAKRVILSPDAVEALASELVLRLAQFKPRDAMFETPQISDANIAAFCDTLIRPDPGPALRFIEDKRAAGVTRQGVYLGYIPAAARYLGEGWENDRLSFVQVTHGTGHLYALTRALRAEWAATPRPYDERRYALFATVPGEDHGIGITVAAGLFREVGWEIDLQTGTSHDALVAHVDATQPQVIGLSFTTAERLDALVRLVVALRIVMPHAIIGVAAAPTVDAKRLHELVDIDLVFGDAPSACKELERLMGLRG